MEKSVSVDSVIGSLPRICTHDNLVHMSNGKIYRVYRCSCDREVYEYMRSVGFDTKEIVKIELVPPKQRG